MARTVSGGMGTLKNKKRGVSKRLFFYKSDDFWRSFLNAFSYWETFDPLYYRRDPWKADYEALRRDWETVGSDLTKAMRRFELEHIGELEEKGQQQQLFDPDEDT